MMQTVKELVRQTIPPIIRQLEKRIPEPRFYSRSLLHRDMTRYRHQIKVGRVASAMAVEDRAIVERSVRSYQYSVRDQSDLGDSMWKIFFMAKHQKLHDTFMTGTVEESDDILRNPEASELFYGFSMLSQGLFDRSTPDDILKNGCVQYLDWLLCLAEDLRGFRMQKTGAH